MKKTFFGLLASLFILPAVSSCSSNDDGPSTNYYQAFVTYQSKVGDRFTFIYQSINDAPERLLWDDINLGGAQTVLKPGMRVYLTFEPKGAVVPGANGAFDYDGEIEVASIARVYQDTVAEVTDVPTQLSEPYSGRSIFRTGKFINLIAVAPLVNSFDNRSYEITVDASTVGSEYPEMYITTSLAAGTTTSYDTNNFCSFYIAPVWDRLTCKGVKVHYDTDRDGTLDGIITFEKQ